MRSLSLKLILAFLVVSLTGIAIFGFFTARSTSDAFGQFVLNQYQESVMEQLVTHYRSHSSWEGLELTLQSPDPFKPSGQSPQFRGIRSFILTTSSGEIVIPGMGFREGGKLPRAELNRSIPVEVDGEVVGFLLMQSGPFREGRPEAAFINQVYRVLMLSAGIAVAVALLLGIFLARTLTRPLGEITEATEAVAAGDLDQTVPVRSKDELGRLAESFNQMNSRLARARDLRHQLTADIAHELRTPVSVIMAHVDGMQDGVIQPTTDTIAVLQDEANRLNRIIDDLRLLSLAETQELHLERVATEVKPLLEQTAKSHRAEGENQQVEIVVQVEQALPLVYADPDRILQVLSNLIANALRFTPEGGKIRLSGTDANDEVLIGVQDTGPGIPSEDLPYVFDRFYKADKSRSRSSGEGSGLGLAIAKSIVDRHNGRIWVESNLGEGATIYFTLPETKLLDETAEQ